MHGITCTYPVKEATEVRLYLLTEPPASIDDWQPGMMWPSELLDEDGAGYSIVLCRHTYANGHSHPIVWHTKETTDDGKRWDVTGKPPNITVNPSINVIGIWHGWIRNGALSNA